MARIEHVVRVCDLHDGVAEGSRTIFVVDGWIYQIDACPEHKAELRFALTLVERARAAYLATTPKRTARRARPTVEAQAGHPGRSLEVCS